ncbi:MAG: hypothetical protein JWO67_1970 [Streptosporangiaceae bacterium]|nr:hypothetical protein [Streptosporangiaceae bacterium]
MRVRVVEKTRAYWEYAVREFEKGEEILGDLARHLVANSAPGTVEVLEADPEPEPESEQAPAAPENPGPPAGDPPVDGTIDDLMTWIGDDKDRAAQALAAEQAKDNPRVTVIKRLAAPAE